MYDMYIRPKIPPFAWIIRVMICFLFRFMAHKVCCSFIMYNEPYPKSFVSQHCPVFLWGAVSFLQRSAVWEDFAAHRRWAIRSFVLGIGSFEFRVLLYAGASRWQTGRVKLMCSSMCWMLKPPGVLKCQGVKCHWGLVEGLCLWAVFWLKIWQSSFLLCLLCLVGGNLGDSYALLS